MVQVFPVLLLALVFDSGYLHRLRGQTRRPHGEDPGGVRFWSKRRVRVWTLIVTSVTVVEIGFVGLVLADAVADNVVTRALVLLGLGLILGTLLTRIWVDVIEATRD